MAYLNDPVSNLTALVAGCGPGDFKIYWIVCRAFGGVVIWMCGCGVMQGYMQIGRFLAIIGNIPP